MDIPDAIEPLELWRGWRWDGSFLRSPYRGAVWVPGEPFVARCEADHLAPNEDCRCGIYAVELRFPDPSVSSSLPDAFGDVLGKVKLWGKVIPGSSGARAQFAYPSALWVQRDLLEDEALLAYGVPLFCAPERNEIRLGTDLRDQAVAKPPLWVRKSTPAVSSPARVASPVGGPRPGFGVWAAALKRSMDVAVSAAALAILIPVFALFALLIVLDSGKPVLYRERRLGRGGHEFTRVKFRTLVQGAGRFHTIAHLNRHLRTADQRMFKVTDDPRITRFGRLIRRASLDHLPQLLNVLTGEMSLVGPCALTLGQGDFLAAHGYQPGNARPGNDRPSAVSRLLGASG